MKKVKGIILIVLCMLMVFGSVVNAANVESVEQKEFREKLLKHYSEDISVKAETLKVLDILHGTDKGLELEKGLTRAEGAAIYARLFGLADYIYELNKKGYKTPFKDIPKWVEKDINYLYKNNIVAGTSENLYGANEAMTAEQFTTLVLRGLGYSDKNGEFKWNKSLDKALEIGMINNEEKDKIEKNPEFTREEMVIIAYNALFAIKLDTGNTLLGSRYGFSYHNYISYIIYEQLTEEELAELDKTREDKTYIVFEKDKVKQNTLFKKVDKVLKDVNSLITIQLDGKAEKIEIGEVVKIQYYEDTTDIVKVFFGDNTFEERNLLLKGGKLVYKDTKVFIDSLCQLAIEKTMKTLGKTLEEFRQEKNHTFGMNSGIRNGINYKAELFNYGENPAYRKLVSTEELNIHILKGVFVTVPIYN